LKDGDHILLKQGLIENTNNNGFGDRESLKLTDKAKKDLLLEHNHKGKGSKKGLILCSTLAEKKMFYNAKEEALIAQLSSLLEVEKFKTVQKRLTESKMRTGFACIFYGAPGTGKTETVYQLARGTGRDVMMVNISETKSMWYGESEKKIKEVFDNYKNLVKNSDVAPILLFNEADAVIGKRLENTQRSVDQTANAIQNIILQEMENLDGIMIATTNLTQNLDKAFERRFLYKIEFAKPSVQAKQSIWQAMIPELNDDDSKTLASSYDFSGGQIENVARKRTVESIISGSEPSFETIRSYCDCEQLSKNGQRQKMGF
jgi:SpoVK/Ycf46/Vps4 family AAA+-type ATPase